MRVAGPGTQRAGDTRSTLPVPGIGRARGGIRAGSRTAHSRIPAAGGGPRRGRRAGGRRRGEGGAGVLRSSRGYPIPVRPTPSMTLTSVVEGAAAGVAATVVMTAVLEVGRRLSLFRTHPPARIVRRVLAGSPQRRLPSEVLLTGLAHLSYGASCGAVFALLTRRHSAAGPRLGVGYGLLLWLAGYGGWVPAIGAVPPPNRDRPGRQLTLVAGHVVYGAVLAEGLHRWRRRSQITRASDPRGTVRIASLTKSPSQ